MRLALAIAFATWLLISFVASALSALIVGLAVVAVCSVLLLGYLVAWRKDPIVASSALGVTAATGSICGYFASHAVGLSDLGAHDQTTGGVFFFDMFFGNAFGLLVGFTIGLATAMLIAVLNGRPGFAAKR